MTHLLKLVDKMCRYQMDPASFVEDTEWTPFGLNTDRQMDKGIDGQTEGLTK